MSPRKKSSGGRAFTVEFPTPLPVEQRGDAWWMEAEGRELRLSNLDKVFWPVEGYTKGPPPRPPLKRPRPAPAVPARASPHDEADARRDGRTVLLREDGAVAH